MLNVAYHPIGISGNYTPSSGSSKKGLGTGPGHRTGHGQRARRPSSTPPRAASPPSNLEGLLAANQSACRSRPLAQCRGGCHYPYSIILFFQGCETYYQSRPRCFRECYTTVHRHTQQKCHLSKPPARLQGTGEGPPPRSSTSALSCTTNPCNGYMSDVLHSVSVASRRLER